MSDFNERNDLNQSLTISPKLNLSQLSVSVDCEYCGLKYKTVQDKDLHQIYYCIGRDLSLDKSKIKLSSNNNFKKSSLKSIETPNLLFGSTNSTNSNNVISKNMARPEDLNIKGFKYPSSILKTPRLINIDKFPDKLKSSNYSNINSSARNSSRTVSFKMDSNIKVYVLRLRPNQDLFKELDNFVKENDLNAAFIITCVGSLTKATIRMAYSGQEQNEVKVFNEHLEIVSLVGTLSSTGGHHLHISVSNKDGSCIGGHVFGEMNVFTTAEIVIGECSNLKFDREFDSQSGFDELVVRQK